MLIDDLKPLVDGEVTNNEKDLLVASHDASIFEIKPQVIVRPKNVADIRNLVTFVSKEKHSQPGLSLTARSAGTDMGGGPLSDSIVVEFPPHFNRILEIGDDYAVVEPGVYWRDLEKEILKKNLIMPSYPASRLLCTVGGMVNNNSGGEKSLSHGQTKDYIEELQVILADGNEYTVRPLTLSELHAKKSLNTFEGELYRKIFDLIQANAEEIKNAKPKTSKNSSGYFLWDVWDGKTFNMCKLISGAQGTLGFVTKIKFRLIHYKQKSELLVMFLKDLAPLGEIVADVMQYKPETFESFDNHTLSLAIRFLPDIIKRMKGNAILLGMEFLPEMWMTITGGIPKLILIAEFTGDTEEEIAKNLRKAQGEIVAKYGIKTHITKRPEEADKYWVVRRESFSLLRQHTKGKQTAPFIDDIIVRPQQLPEFLPKLNAILDQYPSLIYTIAGHAGDANFHIIPLMDLSVESNRKIIPELSDKVYDLVLSFKGSITAEHNDGLIRTPYLGKMYGKHMTQLFAQVKHIFDPLGIFNPRKKVGGDLGYAMSHIKKVVEQN
jgi:FAD/FMN-containing dehydrogenase